MLDLLFSFFATGSVTISLTVGGSAGCISAVGLFFAAFVISGSIVVTGVHETDVIFADDGSFTFSSFSIDSFISLILSSLIKAKDFIPISLNHLLQIVVSRLYSPVQSSFGFNSSTITFKLGNLLLTGI